jgi:hypothetical protein
MLSLSAILFSISPFAAVAQSCNRYSAAPPAYVGPAYPAYAAPYSGYYDYNAPTYTAPGYDAYIGSYRYYSNPWRNGDWNERRAWRERREHEWREHREHEWREHEWHERGRRDR